MAKKTAVLIMAAFFFHGCAPSFVTRTEGAKIDKEELKNIRPGSSTRDDVIRLFGSPVESSVEGGSEKMLFRYVEKKVPSYLGGKVESEVQGKEKTVTLEVVIRDGVVTSYSYKSTEDR